jgi:hypothetical protein
LDAEFLFDITTPDVPKHILKDTRRLINNYMLWDTKMARNMDFKDEADVPDEEGDWYYLQHNVRVHCQLRYLIWGPINHKILWTVDNFNGYEFINGPAQISLCPDEKGVRILVFGQASSDQMQFVDNLFATRGTLADTFIKWTNRETHHD